jgi:hypothetical protein
MIACISYKLHQKYNYPTTDFFLLGFVFILQPQSPIKTQKY